MTESSAKIPPERLELRAKPRPVTRLNRRSLAMVMVGTGILILIATLWALRGPRAPSPNTGDDARIPPSVPRAEGLVDLPEDYSGWRPVPKLGPPIGELGRPVLRAERDAGIDSFGSNTLVPNPDVDAERVARLRLQDEAQAAAKAAVFFQTRRSISPLPASNERSQNHTVTDLDNRHTDAPGVAPSAEQGGQDQPRKQEFFEGRHSQSSNDDGQLQEARSSYQLTAGTIIPAALVTGINSDLPGQTIATVTQNVYDTVTGDYLLIPQGARLLGRYDSQVSFGQRRVLLVWTRLIFPNGTSISLDRLPATDTAGYAGLEDGVDWHWRRVFAGAAVSTLLGVNAELAAPDRGLNSQSLIVASRQSVQDTINQVGQQLTRRNLDIQPTLRIRPGFLLRIVINKDLILRSYAEDATRRKYEYGLNVVRSD